MLAARDQENLVHGHQTAAAAKPLNQSSKQLQPKTPGNKVPKSPFKVPLNDENGPSRFGPGKTALKVNGRGNENFMTGGKKGGLGDKNAFITPLGPRNRAPLGLKTTNAKTKVFQTPAPPGLENEVNKEATTSASTRKAKPKASHAEMTKLKVLGDKDELEVPEIEYMPPKPKDMPDYPDDMPHDLDFSIFQNGGLTRNYMQHFMTRVGDDGLTFYERQEQKRLKEQELAEKIADATLLRNCESTTLPCVHDPECIDMECTANIENRRAAEEKYQKTLAALSATPKPQTQPIVKKPALSKGPSTLMSKSAAAVLSQPTRSTIDSQPKLPPKTSLSFIKPASILSRPKRTPQPTNPSPMRHAASSATSKTTLGHSKGRIASAALRKPALTAKERPLKAQIPDPTLAPGLYIERYGVPKLGSEMWVRCKDAGCFDEEREEDLGEVGNELDDFLREEAEREFVLSW